MTYTIQFSEGCGHHTLFDRRYLQYTHNKALLSYLLSKGTLFRIYKVLNDNEGSYIH